MPTRFRQQAYASVKDDPVTTVVELWEDLVRGRLFIFTEASGPYASNLMESKLTYVAQVDVTDPGKLKTRYISDPILEINERATSENRPTCVILRHQNIARRLLFSRALPGNSIANF